MSTKIRILELNKKRIYNMFLLKARKSKVKVLISYFFKVVFGLLLPE